MNSIAVVITGLPASGKTTLGRQLAARFGWAFVDKDDVLEALFESTSVRDTNDRRRLSRESDALFRDRASEFDEAVLVSHWRPTNELTHTGTPTDWLSVVFETVVEVHCICDPAIAATRFINRKRHIGHLDRTRSPDEVMTWMSSLSSGYPLGIGAIVSVDSKLPCDVDDVSGRIEVVLRRV